MKKHSAAAVECSGTAPGTTKGWPVPHWPSAKNACGLFPFSVTSMAVFRRRALLVCVPVRIGRVEPCRQGGIDHTEPVVGHVKFFQCSA